MGTRDRKWLRDILVVPLIVGLIIAFFQFVLPQLTQKKKELSYEIYPAITFINRAEIKDVDLTVLVNGIETGFIEVF